MVLDLSLSLIIKGLQFTPYGCKNKGNITFEFLARTQPLCVITCLTEKFRLIRLLPRPFSLPLITCEMVSMTHWKVDGI